MSSFLSQLVVTPMPDGRKWKLFLPFTYHIGSRYSDNSISVPIGFVTDFASVPWPLWAWLPSWGKYGKAAVLHDWMYSGKVFRTELDPPYYYFHGTRKEADDIFNEAMLVGGTKKWRAEIMYYFVRIFGIFSWRY